MNSSIWNARWMQALSPILFALVFLGLWQLAGWLTPTYQLPTVVETWNAMLQKPWVLLKHGLYTLWPTLIGFGVAIVVGVVMGLSMGMSKFVYQGAYPILVFFNALPKVAIAPILVLSFPSSFELAVWMAFLICFFPIVVNVATSAATVDREMEDVLRALGAGKWTIAWKVSLPQATPHIFGALKIAVTLAFIGTIIAEQQNANEGLGWFITVASANSQTALGFAALVVLGVESVILYAIFAVMEARTARWAFRSH
ncbi:MAG: ABC transporter permease [Neomegalonema sp.]|nr:ABC transporter permease [Neomegalonema sp.]